MSQDSRSSNTAWGMCLDMPARLEDCNYSTALQVLLSIRLQNL
jgi:hypothetical protein